jgi:hypothetical protein
MRPTFNLLLKASFIYILILSSTSSIANTYYLKTANQGTAQTAANWNTDNTGGGGATNATNFTTNGDIFIVLSGQTAVFGANTTFGSSTGGGAGITVTIQSGAQVTINTGVAISLNAKNFTTVLNVSGVIIFSSASANQITPNAGAGGTVNFVLASGATLKTVNANGVSGTNCSLPATGFTNLFFHSGANYEFNGTAQAMTGINDSVNNLTLSVSGAKTWSVVSTIQGNLTTSGTVTTATTLAVSVASTLTVGAGTTLTMGNFAFTASGTTSVSGTLSTGTGNTGTRTFTGAVTVNSGGVWNLSGQNPATSFGAGIAASGTTFNNGTGAAAFSADQSLSGSTAMTFGGTLTPASGKTLTNDNSNTVTVSSTGSIVLTGNFTQGLNSSLSLAAVAPFSGSGTFDASTNTNTVTYTGAAAPVKAVNYSSLTVNGAGITLSGTVVVSGTLTVSNTFTNNGTLTVTTNIAGASTLTQGANSTLTYTGSTITPTLAANSNTNTVDYDASGPQTVKGTTYRNLKLSGSGSKTTTSVTVVNVLTIQGTATASAAITYSGTAYGLVYNTSTARNASTNEWPATFSGTAGVTISNTGTITAAAIKTFAANVPLTVDLGATLDAGSFVHAASGAGVAVTINGTFKTANTSGFSGGAGTTAISSANSPSITLGSGSTIEYTVTAGGQTITGRAYANLTLDNTGGTNPASGNISTTGALTTTAGGTLNMVTFTLLDTTVSNAGTIRTQNINSGSPLSPSKTWGGTVNYDATTGLQNIVGGTYATLTMSNSSGTQTARGTLTATTLNTTASGILDMGTNQLSITNITNNGHIQTQNTGSLPIPASLSWGGTVTFNGSASQTLPASSTFTNLIVSNSSVVVMAGTATISTNITFNSSGILSIGSNTLNIGGTITNTTTGGLRGSTTSNLNLTGSTSSLSFDQSTVNTTNVLNNLTFNGSGQTYTLSNALRVVGTVTPTLGTLASGSARLTMASSASATSIIAAFPASGADITGTIKVERYIPGRRAYRFLTSSVTTTGTIFTNWQESGSDTLTNIGYGTHITGSTAANPDGFDVTATGAASMFTWDNTAQQWSNIANTRPNTLTAGVPYRIFVRGDRSVNLGLNNPLATNTILRATGSIVKGSQSAGTLSSTAADYNFIGNPYLAPVNMQTLLTASSGLNTRYYYIWDPTRSTRGAYVTVDVITDTNNVSGSAANRYLQPGQACFVTSTGGVASFTFTEASKGSIANETIVFKTNAAGNPQMRLNLYLTDSLPVNPPPQDGLLIRFDPSYTNSFDNLDALKPGNQDEDIGVDILGGANPITVSIASQKPPLAKDSIQLYFHQNQIYNAVTNKKGEAKHTIKYTLKINLDSVNDLKAFIWDSYLKREKLIKTGVTDTFSFTVETALSGEAAYDHRFVIRFKADSLNGITPKQVNSFRVYPNPVTGNSINIDLGGETITNGEVQIFNMLGQGVYHKIISNSQSGILEINPSARLQPGIYIVKLNSAELTSSFEFIVSEM